MVAKTLLEVGNWKILVNEHQRVGILFKNNTQLIISEADWVDLCDKIIVTQMEKDHKNIKEELQGDISKDFRETLKTLESYLFGKIEFYGGSTE